MVVRLLWPILLGWLFHYFIRDNIRTALATSNSFFIHRQYATHTAPKHTAAENQSYIGYDYQKYLQYRAMYVNSMRIDPTSPSI